MLRSPARIVLLGLLLVFAGCDEGPPDEAAGPVAAAEPPVLTAVTATAPPAPATATLAPARQGHQPVFSGGLVDPRTPDALFSEAMALYSAGRWDEAEPKYRAFLAANPTHVVAHNSFARTLMQEGRTEEAITEFETVLRLDPAKYSAHRWVAECYREVGRDADADRASRAYKVGYASALGAAGRWSEAESLYREVLAADPDLVQARFDYARGLMENGENSTAIEQLLDVLKRDPSRNAAHHLLAESYRAVGDDASADRHAALFEAGKQP